MEALDDITLLREYAAHQSEAAFATLVSRRIGFVYSAALRQVRDPHLAEEVAQAVFIILAQKAGRISQETILTGWLFKTTRFAALAQTRAAAKQSLRTATIGTELQMQTEFQPTEPSSSWEQISPLLDEALASLGESDRRAILLRFFENKALADVGSALNTSEDTARKRVVRALEKLRKYFSRRGLASTSEMIASSISMHSVHTAPPHLALAIAATALKGSTVAASTLTLVKGTLNIMAWIKTKMAIVIGASTILAGTAIVTLHAQEEKIREQEQQNRTEEQQLRAQLQQDNLPASQRQQFQTRLKKLNVQQDQLRQKQNQLRESDTNTFARPSLQLSPFTAVRFDGDKVLVTVSGAEYELAALDDLKTPDILAFSKNQYHELWQKRIAEDLPAVLMDMKHPLSAQHTVNLTLVDPATGEKKTVDNAPMTEANRQAVMKTRLQTGSSTRANAEWILRH
jgi:RNA polymerase sigma factor (sigma-70 family)